MRFVGVLCVCAAGLERALIWVEGLVERVVKGTAGMIKGGIIIP